MKHSSRLLSVALAAVGGTLIGVASPALADPPPALPHGIDVSNHDRGLDWSDPDLAFGAAKATEGTGFADGTFSRNWKEMRENGVVRGAYHFGRPANDPVKEADHFLSAVQKQGLVAGDLLMLDLEVTDGKSTRQVNTWAKRWLEHVTAKTGVKPFFYSSWSFAQQYGEGLGGYPLWVAHYGKAPGKVTAPKPWTGWAIHQYEATDHDHNVSGMPAERLKSLGYQAR